MYSISGILFTHKNYASNNFIFFFQFTNPWEFPWALAGNFPEEQVAIRKIAAMVNAFSFFCEKKNVNLKEM